MANGKPRVHYYHAEAGVLHAQLQRPLQQEIKPQAFVKVHDKLEPAYLSERSENYRLEGIISFKSAYTHVSGHESTKAHRRWITLSTSVVEGLNVFEVITADRIVGQISTEHPRDEDVPHVTFLGTRFENLRIAGHEVHTKLNLNTCGPKPERDRLYLEDQGFLNNVSKHHKRVSGGFSDDVNSSYKLALPEPGELRQQWIDYLKDETGEVKKPKAEVKSSLVEELKVDGWKSGGHVIEVPEFGKIFLAELKVDCNSFALTMIRFELGCFADGSGSFGSLVVNGGGKPGGH
jgi:hypothetical protein